MCASFPHAHPSTSNARLLGEADTQ